VLELHVYKTYHKHTCLVYNTITNNLRVVFERKTKQMLLLQQIARSNQLQQLISHQFRLQTHTTAISNNRCKTPFNVILCPIWGLWWAWTMSDCSGAWVQLQSDALSDATEDSSGWQWDSNAGQPVESTALTIKPLLLLIASWIKKCKCVADLTDRNNELNHLSHMKWVHILTFITFSHVYICTSEIVWNIRAK